MENTFLTNSTPSFVFLSLLGDNDFVASAILIPIGSSNCVAVNLLDLNFENIKFIKSKSIF